MAKFKVGEVVWDTLQNRACCVLGISHTTVLGKMTDIYRCYENEPDFGSYRAEGELNVVKGEAP